MSQNLPTYLSFAAVVLATLWWKGYLKLPAGLVAGAATATPAPIPPSLERLDSHTLGVAFAQAKRREAEEEIAHTIARDAGESIRRTFQAPFSTGPDDTNQPAR